MHSTSVQSRAFQPPAHPEENIFFSLILYQVTLTVGDLYLYLYLPVLDYLNTSAEVQEAKYGAEEVVVVEGEWGKLTAVSKDLSKMNFSESTLTTSSITGLFLSLRLKKYKKNTKNPTQKLLVSMYSLFQQRTYHASSPDISLEKSSQGLNSSLPTQIIITSHLLQVRNDPTSISITTPASCTKRRAR